MIQSKTNNHSSLILNHLYGLQSFPFYILIFAFSLTSYGINSTKDYVRKNNKNMQNKANFRKSQMNVNKVLTKDYEQMDTWWSGKTKPIQSQLKPIQSQFKPIKANSNPIKANKMPKQTQFKPKQTQFQTAHLLIDRMKRNYLPVALFPLTSPAPRHYNGIFSQISCFWRQMKGFGNE